MPSLTRTVATFTASMATKEIPEVCLRAAQLGVADCVGVMIAGADEPAVRIVSNSLRAVSGAGTAPEMPTGRLLDAADAALSNGVAAHVLDYDDVGIDGHPSAVLTPAILAEAWSVNLSGGDVLSAYVTGYEVWAFLQSLEPGQLHERGFHPTAIWGALSSAAACARLNRLDVEQSSHAIAIAASMASGLVSNFGTMTKSLHAGRAAQTGILAVRLAKSGFTASPDALEHPAGFMRAHSPTGSPSTADQNWDIGVDWRLPKQGLNIKRYPVCYAAHRSIDAILALADQHKIRPENVARIDARIGETQALMLRNHAPQTALEAKFSMQFAAAAALISHSVGLAELTDEFVRRSDVVHLMQKVHSTTTAEVMPDLPFSPEDKVSITLTSGEKLEHPPIAYAKGSWQSQLTDDELAAKFKDCVLPKLGDGQTAALFDRLTNLRAVQSLREVPFIKVQKAA